MADLKQKGTTIGPTIVVRGKLSSQENLVIQGRVEASINCSTLVHVDKEGVVKADITASSVVVSGLVVGNILAESRLELMTDARVVGDVSTPVMIVTDGARLRGKVEMSGVDQAIEAPYQEPAKVESAKVVEPAKEPVVREPAPLPGVQATPAPAATQPLKPPTTSTPARAQTPPLGLTPLHVVAQPVIQPAALSTAGKPSSAKPAAKASSPPPEKAPQPAARVEPPIPASPAPADVMTSAPRPDEVEAVIEEMEISEDFEEITRPADLPHGIMDDVDEVVEAAQAADAAPTTDTQGPPSKKKRRFW